MAEEELSANALVDAKNEYTKLLTSYLTPCITEGFISLYEDAKNEKEEKRKDSRYDDYSEIQIFQDFIKKIPKWNQDIIDKESDRIIQRSKCDWLDRLLYGVFVSNAKVLSIVRIQPKKDDKMRLKIPKLRNFVHKCYVECGRELYKVAYLFDDEDITSIEKQKNIRDINSIVREGVIEAVRKLLPIQDILKDCIGNIGGENTMNSTIQSETTGGGDSEEMFRKFTSSNKLKKGIEEIHSETEGLLEMDGDDDEDSQSVASSIGRGVEESVVSQKSSRSLKKEKEESIVSQRSARSHSKKDMEVLEKEQKEESVVSHRSDHSSYKKELKPEKESTVIPEQKEESLVSLKEESQNVAHHQETSVISHLSEMSNVSKVSEKTNPTIKKIRTSSIIRNKDRRKMEQEQLEQMRRKREPNVEKVERTRDENEIISYDLQDYIQEEYISDNSDN
jgi:hypothetical protein